MKKIFIIVNFIFLIMSGIVISFAKNENIFGGISQPGIYDTKDEVDEYIKNTYGNKTDFKFTTSHNYGVLSTRNVSGTTLKFKYNNQLDMTSVNNKFDLNGDKIITSADNLDREDKGICSPVAAAIAIRYLVYYGKLSYTPRIKNALYGEFTDDPNDVFNVFYELVDSYISCEWKGSGTNQTQTTNAINHFLKRNNSNFNLIYTEKNIINQIDLCYQKGLPCLGYILFDKAQIGHIATIAGYYTKEITYTEKVLFMTQSKKVTLHFVVINTGWTNSTMGDSGGATQKQYDDNYSYVLSSDLIGINYFEEV